MVLIVGLGNPGRQYESTRHNIGFRVADELLRRHGGQNLSKPAFKGDLFKTSDTLILKPMTYMNLSGESVATVAHFYKPDRLVVIHDDLDLPFGALRFKHGGGTGGHNGLKSIDACWGNDYLRVRMGIGRPPAHWGVADFVLAPFGLEQLAALEGWIARGADASWRLRHESLADVSSLLSQKEIAC